MENSSENLNLNTNTKLNGNTNGNENGNKNNENNENDVNDENTDVNTHESNLSFEAITNEELENLWNITANFAERDKIIAELQRRNLFPSKSLSEWEYDTGAYPDTRDPMFLNKLLAKREFAESLQNTWKPRSNPCEDDSTFEVTPVQQFVANFMSPKTPYMSALLFHGVGVGKTCAAVQIIEAWLEAFPRNEILLVAPPTIQQGFFRTIFDISKVIIGEGKEPNMASQCTGTTYMKLTNTLYERDPVKIEKAVTKLIRRRYKVFGYISFANYIRDALKGIPSTASDEIKAELKKKYIRQKFSGKLLIIDEAHNLRDLTDETDAEDTAFTGGKAEKSDAVGGKLLTPFLRDVLQYSEGMKFCLLTATPMYNSYREIIFILNLLLINDKKATITEADVFNKEGVITEKGKQILSHISQRYVSFMRGENPISFPVRLFPDNIPSITSYPTLNPRGMPIPENERNYYTHLPIVPIVLSGDVLKATIAFMNALPPGKGLNPIMLEKLVHAGNFIVPSTEGTADDTIQAYRERTDINGLNQIFIKESSGGETRFRARTEDGAKWLAVGELEQYSPKFSFLISHIRNAEGCAFAYTRFVNAGALPLALALEANGYSAYGRKSGLLVNGIQVPGGKQCALCPKKEKEHGNTNHQFVPAYYGILTGDSSISPRNEQTIRAQRAFDNADGSKMKIIIGSQIAGEGVDLRFIRETHVIDSWFHLNRTEQILGRAIRFLSHCALPKEKRNNTVYLYAAELPPMTNGLGEGSSATTNSALRETADLYSYRVGFKKAVLVGHVTRIMKQSAIDCNLNKNAIIIKGQEPIVQIDSQGRERRSVNINDMPFTAVCDWIETCDYECQPKIDVKKIKLDDSTYDEFAARWRVNKMKAHIRTLFSEQSFYQSEDLWNIFSDIPRLAVVDLLNDIIDNKNFQVTNNGLNGYIRYCNGYYIFQPNVYADLTIPLAIRAAKFPVKKDTFMPIEYEIPELDEEKELEKVDSILTIEKIWIAISEWIAELSHSATYIKPPPEINQRIEDISQEDMESLEKYRQIVEMIEYFHYSFRISTNKNPDAFRRALTFYFWDEWLTLEEQKFIVYSTDINVLECIKESQYMLGRILVNRFVNPKNGEIEYMCEGGIGCVKSIIDDIHRNKTEPIQTFVINTKTTGNPYGFNAPKNGIFVFKTGEAAESGKVGLGRECGNVPNMAGHISYLIQIGDVLRMANKTDFDLTREKLLGTRKIKNSTRACTLINFLIRYMDADKIRDLRWFFRPLQALYTGHKGLFRSGKKEKIEKKLKPKGY